LATLNYILFAALLIEYRGISAKEEPSMKTVRGG